MKFILIFLLFSILSISAKNLESKIYYGDYVDISFAPYQVEIFLDYLPNCGGSLLSETFVLTAAHCTESDKNPKSYSIGVGTRRILDIVMFNIKVIKIIDHPEYDKTTVFSDFSLFQMEKVKKFPKSAAFVKLPNKDDVLKTGEIMNIAGFGRTENGVTIFLKGGSIPIYDQEKCKELFGHLEKTMICAGYEKPMSTGSCFGDSGSGLVRRSDGKIFGVTSFIFSEKCSTHPAVYSKVTAVLDWINEIVFKDH
ncbi:hypothetical protein PVAND_013559 [Polypedilum vanderplanki]|uniref:trypsin n=1 Tax=Polypedilum vanderplanki TaxID=319348 RepID=A0A9J6CR11_POLVA|nr:hypothetical protein PVAND_013559 [Polypedilum vanderplanki]